MEKIEVVNDKLREEFRKIKLIYIVFLIEPFVLFGVMLVFCYFMRGKIEDFLAAATLSRTLPRTVSLVFIILSVIEYYSIVILIRRLNTIIGTVKDTMHYSSRYLNVFILLLSIAAIPSIFGFVYYLISFDIIFSSLFYLISLVSILRVLPRFNDFRDRYIDLSEEDI
ncbi:MAG: hypothetical protein GWP03_05400 [Proteobacteria bacterium]|nr:hypothetical protein [Pseudomonadota bacterium]